MWWVSQIFNCRSDSLSHPFASTNHHIVITLIQRYILLHQPFVNLPNFFIPSSSLFDSINCIDNLNIWVFFCKCIKLVFEYNICNGFISKDHSSLCCQPFLFIQLLQHGKERSNSCSSCDKVYMFWFGDVFFIRIDCLFESSDFEFPFFFIVN